MIVIDLLDRQSNKSLAVSSRIPSYDSIEYHNVNADNITKSKVLDDTSAPSYPRC